MASVLTRLLVAYILLARLQVMGLDTATQPPCLQAGFYGRANSSILNPAIYLTIVLRTTKQHYYNRIKREYLLGLLLKLLALAQLISLELFS